MYIVYANATSNTLCTESEKEKTMINNHLDSSSTCCIGYKKKHKIIPESYKESFRPCYIRTIEIRRKCRVQR